MRWVPTDVEAQARGIVIQRILRDDDGPLIDRSLVAGQPAVLEVTVTTDARHRYVALDVPIPAGVELIDRSLGRGGASAPMRVTAVRSTLPYSHHELRGDRALVFVDELPAGTYRYRVPVRATHEGTYAMPPATAHAMYSPEVSGNTDAQNVRVVSP
jgi:uncharacterized protein YfaS (alpha-2-macroglobulin family)